MNRRGGTTKQVKQYFQGMNDSDVDDDYLEDKYDDQQWEIIEYIASTMNVTTKQAADVLEETNFEENAAIDILTEQREREKEKQEIKQKKKSEQSKKNQEKKKQKQVQEALEKKKSTCENPQRKISNQDLPTMSVRKSSLIVEQYDKDHYNKDYPNLDSKQPVQPSKTLNVVVVGHVDSGKSTLVGKLMYMIEVLSSNHLHKHQKQSKLMGRQSFKYAWVTDQTEEERTRGVTIDIGVKKIVLKDRNIVFLDSPGHQDFVPNMITGAAQADYAILVIDATHFDSTFINGGQTKEHAYIVKSLGVQIIMVAVNKMDLVDWNPQAFEAIKKKLNFYLLDIGFQQQNIIYVPVSAFCGINIHPKLKKQFVSNQVSYNKTLIETLESLNLPIRPINKPLRVNITNFYESPVGKIKGHCISGKIEGGVLTKGQKVVILPQDCQCLVKQILVGDQKVKQAVVGDNVEIQIKLIDETYFETITHGNVLSSLKYSVPVTNKFIMQAMALELDIPILKGTAVMAYIGSNKTTARITKIVSKYDPNTGAIIKKNCKSIKSNDCVVIEVEADQKICVQKFSNFKTFGRVILRQKKSTLCVGTVTSIK